MDRKLGLIDRLDALIADPRNPPLASPPTLCRLEIRVSRRTLAEIAKSPVEAFIESHKALRVWGFS